MIILLLLCAAATAYQLLAIIACLRHLWGRPSACAELQPGISILKPVAGAAGEHFYQAIRSHALISYPDFEILFGVPDQHGPAVNQIERLKSEFPQLRARIIVSQTSAPNHKVGVLEDLARQALHPVWVVNDADISVPPDYLHRLAGALDDPQTGLVTCLYRATSGSLPGKLEAVGIATDFAPGVLVAPLAGVKVFGLGSTLAFRAADLQRAGGFQAIRDYLADDYQLAVRISQLGLKVRLAKFPVSTHVSGAWRDVWRHQVRWARTIRVSQSGYFGLPVANATLWAALALIAGFQWFAAALLALRIIAGLICGALVLKDPATRRNWWLMPVRDLLGLAVWIAGAFGNSVIWRGRRLGLTKDGRIVV